MGACQCRSDIAVQTKASQSKSPQVKLTRRLTIMNNTAPANVRTSHLLSFRTTKIRTLMMMLLQLYIYSQYLRFYITNSNALNLSIRIH